MASTEQKAAPPSGTAALDSLQAMVNLVLTQTGRYIKEAAAGGGSGRTAFAMKRAIPAATERFHESLDELENELKFAQAVLRRDLAVLQADRQKREQAEAAERQRLAAESSAKKVIEDTKEKEKKDVTMTDAPPAQTSTEPTTSAPGVDVKPELATTAPDRPAPIATTSAPDTDLDALFDGTPTTANPQDTEFDFDAMFGTEFTAQAQDGSNDAGNVDLDQPGQDLNFTLDDDTSGPSLLPGLEDFANSGNDTTTSQPPGNVGGDIDLNMLDMPSDNKDEEAKKNTAADTGAQQQSTDAQNADQDLMNTDSNLDDLFSFDYEPPEGTEFEDAFFGFDES